MHPFRCIEYYELDHKSKEHHWRKDKKARLDKGLSQQDVERIATLRGMDITRSKLAKIETGMIRVTDEILHNLAVVLDVSVNVFLMTLADKITF
ncbi:TPA: helix-turn-helix domain-containing protein [Vibrio cholerae]